MRCGCCGRAKEEPAEESQAVTVGPVTLTIPRRVRKAVTWGLRWTVGVMIGMVLVLLDLALMHWFWPAGLLFLSVLLGAVVAVYIYMEVTPTP